MNKFLRPQNCNDVTEVLSILYSGVYVGWREGRDVPEWAQWIFDGRCMYGLGLGGCDGVTKEFGWLWSDGMTSTDTPLKATICIVNPDISVF